MKTGPSRVRLRVQIARLVTFGIDNCCSQSRMCPFTLKFDGKFVPKMNLDLLRSMTIDQTSQLLLQNEAEFSVMPAGVDPLDQLDSNLDSFSFLFILSRRLNTVPQPNLLQKAFQFSLTFQFINHRLFHHELQILL